MKINKENKFLSKVTRKVIYKVIGIIIVLELVLIFPVHNLKAQNNINVNIKKLEIMNPKFDFFDSTLLVEQIAQTKIRIIEDTIVIRQKSGVIRKLLKTEIETKLGKDSVQNFLDNHPQNYQMAFVDYQVYDNSLLLVKLFLGNNENAVEPISTLVINDEYNIYQSAYNNLAFLKSFDEGSFVAIKGTYDNPDTIYFFSSNGILINTSTMPPWSMLEVDNGLLKAHTTRGDINLFSNSGKKLLSRSMKNIIKDDLFDFFISPDSSDIYLSTFLSKELIRYSLVDNKIVWRVESNRIKKCLFDLENGLIFTDGIAEIPINNNQECLIKHFLSILLIDSGNLVRTFDNNELLNYKNKSIISKEGGKYYEYIIN